MTKISASMWLQRIHAIVACFFLPIALVFAITGGFYTLGIKGSYQTQSKTVAAELPANPTLEQLVDQAKSIVRQEFNGEIPSGTSSMRKVGNTWQFEWTGSRADFTLEPGTVPGQFKASFKATNPYRRFVQLHKAKGGPAFKVMAVGMALGILILLGSGMLIAMSRPPLRKIAYFSLALGISTLAAVTWMS